MKGSEARLLGFMEGADKLENGRLPLLLASIPRPTNPIRRTLKATNHPSAALRICEKRCLSP